MKKRGYLSLFILVILNLFNAVFAEEAPYKLAWKLNKGTALEYNVTVSNKGKAAGATPMSMSASAVLTFTIRAPREGIALVDVSPKNVTMTMNNKKMPQTPAMTQALEAHTLLSTTKGWSPYGTMPQSQRNLFEMLFPLPAKPVKVGDQWPMKIQLLTAGSGGIGKESNVAVLKKIRQDGKSSVAVIDFSSKGTIKPANKVQENEQKSGPKLSMTVTGSAVFDITNGFLISNDNTAAMKMNIAPGGTMDMTNVVTVKLVRKSTLTDEEIKKLSTILKVREAIARAIQLARKGKNQEALDIVLKVVDEKAKSEHAHLIAAQLYTRVGKWKESAKEIEK